MGNVINLPDKPVRSWRVFEDALREHLEGLTADNELIDHVCMAIRPIYLKVASSEFVGLEMMTNADMMAALDEWVKNLVFGLLLTLAAREIDLYKLREKYCQ